MSSLFAVRDEYHVDAFGCHMTVLGLPQSGGSKRIGRNRRSGRAIVLDDNPAAAGWKETVGKIAMALMAGRKPMEGPLELSVTFYMPRPKWHYGNRGSVVPRAPKYPVGKPDTTKLVRPLEDALTGIVWRDDAQVVQQVASKRWCNPGEERAHVRVSVLH